MALPYLSKTVVVEETNYWLLYEPPWQGRGSQEWISPTFYTQNVWVGFRIFLRSRTHEANLHRIFSHCPNANNIAITGAGLQLLVDAGISSLLKSSNFRITVQTAYTHAHDRLFVEGEHCQNDFLDKITELNLKTIGDPTTAPLDLSRFRFLSGLTIGYVGQVAEAFLSVITDIQGITTLQSIAIGFPRSTMTSDKLYVDSLACRKAEDDRIRIFELPELELGWEGWYRSTVSK